MPTYTYRREDGSTFEVRQRITEDPLEECPETGQDVERIITGNGGVIFKGEGFHVNDYDDHGPIDKSAEQENGANDSSDSTA
jgi:putative FmdB family regulatory protein